MTITALVLMVSFPAVASIQFAQNVPMSEKSAESYETVRVDLTVLSWENCPEGESCQLTRYLLEDGKPRFLWQNLVDNKGPQNTTYGFYQYLGSSSACGGPQPLPVQKFWNMGEADTLNAILYPLGKNQKAECLNFKNCYADIKVNTQTGIIVSVASTCAKVERGEQPRACRR